MVLGLRPHDAVAGDLGQDRRRRDRQAAGVALHEHLAGAVADEVPLAVEQHPVGGRPRGRRGPAGRPGAAPPTCPSSSHSSSLAWPTDHAIAPVGDPVEQRLALGLGEHLGVADLVDPAVLGDHGRAEGERARPTRRGPPRRCRRPPRGPRPRAPARRASDGAERLERLAQRGDGSGPRPGCGPDRRHPAETTDLRSGHGRHGGARRAWPRRALRCPGHPRRGAVRPRRHLAGGLRGRGGHRPPATACAGRWTTCVLPELPHERVRRRRKRSTWWV